MGKKAITSEPIKVKGARLAFVQLDKATKIGKSEDEVAKYRLTALLDPSNKDHAVTIDKIKSEAKRIALEMWDGEIPKSLEKCFGSGNDLDKIYNGFADMFFIKLNNSSLPPIVGRTKDPGTGTFIQLQPGKPGFPYGGCYGNLTLTTWTQDSHGAKRIGGNLLAVQFSHDGESFGGGSKANADDEFESLPEGTTGAPAGKDPFD